MQWGIGFFFYYIELFTRLTRYLNTVKYFTFPELEGQVVDQCEISVVVYLVCTI